MQPHDPYNNPDHGGQYPSGPYPPQGGAHPSGGYAQPPGHGPSGGYPPPYGQPGGMPPGPPPTGPAGTDPGAAKMPGTVIAVRIFQFIGGVSGLLIGGAFWVGALMMAGDQAAVDQTNAALEAEGVGGAVSANEVIGGLGLLGAIPFFYGLISTLLASFMGKRNGIVLWGTVVFQVLSALFLGFLLVTGGVAGIIVVGLPLLFTIGIIVLMLVQPSRNYFAPTPQGPAPHGYGPGPQY
ncbi:hypothetical protein [Nocardiopsis salina]|uniref:hypothetical protein n=1 Tax=Nocardiopsis salina TaxID=245836 RepID=UPI00034D4007|nr:hypothetical protein [Nocardiopsis salina]